MRRAFGVGVVAAVLYLPIPFLDPQVHYFPFFLWSVPGLLIALFLTAARSPNAIYLGFFISVLFWFGGGAFIGYRVKSFWTGIAIFLGLWIGVGGLAYGILWAMFQRIGY